MKNRETPIKIEGIEESLYGGFWIRVGSGCIDVLILSPFIIGDIYLNSQAKIYNLIILLPQQILLYWYSIHFVNAKGGTPGKLICGLKIIKITGESVGWKEAIIRVSPSIIFSLLFTINHAYCLLKADDLIYNSLPYAKQYKYLMSFSPIGNKLFWVEQPWFLLEAIVLIVNKRKRAIHDLIAGTVVVKAKYIGEIRRVMNEPEVQL